jgi:hypothetical protein
LVVEHREETAESRRLLLARIGRNYVLDWLAKGDFDSIPYHSDVELRAPLCPGGSSNPLRGRQELYDRWWQPLPELVAGVELLDVYLNEPLTAVAVEFLCRIREPDCTLRITDRFVVDDEGRITSQENFFDPRDVTQPGWR